MNKRLLALSIIILIFSCIVAVNDNLDKIFETIAYRNFKKNNIATAQKYYEKAFELGLNSEKSRDIYINSIINSPLNIESQEKLVKFIKYSFNDSAQSKAILFLNDLKNEINKKYEGNYIANASHNHKIVRWTKTPILYKFINKEIAPYYFVREIENAITEWENATENQILFSETDEGANILIEFEEKLPTEKDDFKFVVAYTMPTIIANNLKETKIKFYLKDPEDNFFTTDQIYNTALHELVHALGFMGHSDNKENLMFASRDSIWEKGNPRYELSEADINTVKLLYHIIPDVTNSDRKTGEYIPYLLIGSEEDIYNTKVNEAKNYVKNAPTLPAGYVDLAENYVANEEYSKALRQLKLALRVCDSTEMKWIIYYNLAVVYFYLEDIDYSKGYLRKAQIIRDAEEIHLLFAQIYKKEQNYTAAEEEYKYLIKINPKNIDYALQLTNIYVLNKNYLKARKVLKNYVKSNPTDKNSPKFKDYGALKLFL